MFPAVALAGQLQKISPVAEIFFVGGGLKNNPFFQDAGFAFEEIASSTISTFRPFPFIKATSKIVKGFWQSLSLLRRFQPDVVISFGSYHTLPLLAACRFHSAPVVLHESNCAPGRVIYHFSKYAHVTGVQFPEVMSRLRGKAIDVGMPLRDGYAKALSSKTEARAFFGLEANKFTILAFGGSQGAVKLNTILSSAIADHLAPHTRKFQLIHLTGEPAAIQQLQEKYKQAAINSYTAAFEKQMHIAWSAADLVISRAGAASIAEQIEFEVPGILIPYPHATENHQEKNADHMVTKVGGALKLLEDQLTAEQLAKTVSSFVAEDQKQLLAMKNSIYNYKRSIRRRDLCSIVCEVAGIKVR